MDIRNNPFRKTLAMILSVAMVLGMVPITAFAEDGSLPVGASGEIIAFEPLGDNVANRMVPLGTSLEDLELPGTLTATVEITQPEAPDDNVQDSGTRLQEDEADPAYGASGGTEADEGDADKAEADGEALATPSDAQKPAGEDNEPAESPSDTGGNGVSQITMPVPVAWAAQPDYDGTIAGTYIFTAEAEGIPLADRVQAPQITVTVGEAQGGVITAFAELPEGIRFQRGQAPILPETVEVTVGGETIAVPVDWESETDASEIGLHVFEATPGGGYALASGVQKPVLSFFRAPFPMARMIGAGNEGNPLQITTAAQLAEIAALVNASKLEEMVFGTGATAQVHLLLMNDIDLSGYSAGSGWTPIGTTIGTAFMGSFDGGEHVITGLYINDTNLRYIGLFGYVYYGATVKNLGVVGVNIQGEENVGGVAGLVSGTVENCYSTGSVSGSSSSSGVGGVAGFVNGTVENCYSTVDVFGNERVGGIVGHMDVGSRVENCYATGSVSGNQNVGGVAGYVYIGRVENCAALNPGVTAKSGSNVGRIAGQNSGGTLTGNIAFDGMTVKNSSGVVSVTDGADDDKNGEGKSAAEINADGTLFGLFADDDIWKTADGALPGLFGQTVEMPAHLLDSDNPFSGGDGSSAENAYQITTAAQLARLAELVNAGNAYEGKFFELQKGLDLSGYASGEGWVPIGKDSTNSFKGSFDGGGNTITGLTINRNSGFQGLFGYIGGNGAVSGLGLVKVSIDAGSGHSIGGVAGVVSGTVTNCFVTGNITAEVQFGGVAGEVFGTVSNCFFAGNVIGGGTAGGVAGVVSQGVSGTVENCYSTGRVSGRSAIGGVAGQMGINGIVRNCYTTASVSGTGISVGGVVGLAAGNSTVENCAALNPSVTTTAGDQYIGRIGGQANGAFIGNIAFSGMLVNGSTVTGGALNDKNGASKSANDIIGDGTLGSLFSSTNGWATENGKLPGLFGQPVKVPGHINDNGSPFAGLGTEDSPYEIETEYQLAKLAELVNTPATNAQYGGTNVHYKLMNDLNLAGQGDENGWVPIGSASQHFRGSFNGNSKTITGLTIHRSSFFQGLFGYVDGGRISNLGLVAVSITSSGSGYVGGIAGMVVNGTVEYCYSTGSVSGGNVVGGVAGVITGGTMENCYSTASVFGSDQVGGVAGGVAGTVKNCYSTGSVNGSQNVGGVAGSVSGTVSNCYSTGSVNGSNKVGGVAGDVNTGRIENCAALNPGITATGGSDAGRVAGAVQGGGTLTGNYAFLDMTGGGNAKTHDDLDGADMTATDAISPDFWTTAANWNTSGWDTAVWDIQTDKLPILRNVGGEQSGESGLYLTPKNAENLTVAVNPTSYPYTGSPITPTVAVEFGTATLTENQDYTLSYTPNNTDVGTVAVTVTGRGGYSGTKTATFAIYATVPDAPTGLSAAPGNGQLALSWTAPANNGGSAITKYQYSASTGVDSWQDIPSSGPSTTGYTVTGLANGTTYTVKVRAVNGVGSGAEVSTTGTPQEPATVPGAPTGLTATPGDRQLALTWTAPASDGGSAITKYQYSASTGADSWQDVPGSGPSTTSYTITGLENGATYTVKVRAVNSVGNGAAASTTGTPQAPATVPGAPTGLTATPGDKHLALTWTAPASDGGSAITKYQYSASMGADSWQDIPSSGPSTTGYTVTGLANGTTYTVKVRAVNSVGSGAEASITGTPTSGGGTGGGSTGDSDADKPITVIPPDQPNMPTVAKREVSGKVENKVLTASITEQMAREAIAAAEKSSKDASKTADGIAVEFAVTGSGDYESLVVNFDAGAIDRLKAAGVKYVKIGSALIDISLDAKAIAEIDRQSTGTVTLSAMREEKLSYPAKAAIGHRPAFDITLKDSKGTVITDLKGGTATIGIAYDTKNNGTGGLYAVYVKPNGQIEWLPNSSYTSGRLIFGTGHFSIFGVGYKAPATAFTDIKGHWARENMEFAASRGLLTGTSATTFSPNTSITRGMFITALGRLSGQDMSSYTVSSFNDVKSGSYYLSYIEWGVKNKIVSGVGGGKFEPDRAITREEMAVMLYNYTKATGYTLPVSVEKITFTDDGSISLWAKDAVKALQQAGIVSGVGGGKFNPKGTATRAEAATILRNLVERIIDESTARGWSRNDAGQWMYYDWQGKRTIGWLSILNSDTKYYFDANGVMVSGKWLQIGGKWYYFYSDGKMARNTIIGEYEVDENGVRKTM